MKKSFFILSISGLLIIIVVFLISYSAWNAANPQKTCASCHEISPSHESWQSSAHREISCLECHGTALSNGLHSLREKSIMLFTHLKEEKKNREIRLSEDQLLEIMKRCSNCHQEEYKKWISGGHSAKYADIFLNEKHNKAEQVYWDCFRCHGMFYEGNIYDLMNPISTSGPWEIIDPGKGKDYTIPCLACHEIHTDNDVLRMPVSLENPKNIFYNKKSSSQDQFPKAGLYIRSDKMHLRADLLPQAQIFDGEREVNITNNSLQRICIQCHAPNFKHQAGSQDDRTLSGVHEGLACMACHETHSNDAANSCTQCHPVISNCGVDHMTMNTSYFNKNSKNNIHHVKCADCHDMDDLRLK